MNLDQLEQLSTKLENWNSNSLIREAIDLSGIKSRIHFLGFMQRWMFNVTDQAELLAHFNERAKNLVRSQVRRLNEHRNDSSVVHFPPPLETKKSKTIKERLEYGIEKRLGDLNSVPSGILVELNNWKQIKELVSEIATMIGFQYSGQIPSKYRKCQVFVPLEEYGLAFVVRLESNRGVYLRAQELFRAQFIDTESGKFVFSVSEEAIIPELRWYFVDSQGLFGIPRNEENSHKLLCLGFYVRLVFWQAFVESIREIGNL